MHAPEKEQKASEILQNTIQTNLSSASNLKDGSRDDIIVEDREDESNDQNKKTIVIPDNPLNQTLLRKGNNNIHDSGISKDIKEMADDDKNIFHHPQSPNNLSKTHQPSTQEAQQVILSRTHRDQSQKGTLDGLKEN